MNGRSSFSGAFFLLPRDRREALACVYRFCREADRRADARAPAAARRRSLSRFTRDFERAWKGEPAPPVHRDAVSAAKRFGLRKALFRELLTGIARDLKPVRFRAFRELHRYAKGVAGAPGLLAMGIFGGRSARHHAYAENLGVSLQVVNMVRDLKEDLQRGRNYFPEVEWRRFGLNPRRPDLKHPNLFSFLMFQLERAKDFRRRAFRSLSKRERGHLPAAEAMAAAYGKLLEKLEEEPLAVLRRRVSLTPWEKRIAALTAGARCFLWRFL